MTDTATIEPTAKRGARRRVVRRLLLWAGFIALAVALAGVALVGIEELKRREEDVRLEVELHEAVEAFRRIDRRWVRATRRPDYVPDFALGRELNSATIRVQSARRLLSNLKSPV